MRYRQISHTVLHTIADTLPRYYSPYFSQNELNQRGKNDAILSTKCTYRVKLEYHCHFGLI